MIQRRRVLTHSASLAALATVPLGALAQNHGKDSIVIGMTLEPAPGRYVHA